MNWMQILRHLEFFARFLAVYMIKLKAFKVLRSSNFDDTYRMIKLEKKEQWKYEREKNNSEKYDKRAEEHPEINSQFSDSQVNKYYKK
jgi:hypothetical protein